ncbi:MAG TPA: hypothetical protein VJP79_01015 [Nitrososphaera sp.]|nr:hypothetical protein [Nitrososphaera sp.]
MSTYIEGRRVEGSERNRPEVLIIDRMAGHLSPDQILCQKAEQQCALAGINYKGLEPIQRLFLTHYRCPVCKLLPLYYLNLAHPKRVRCNKCRNLITFTNAGKYGRLRKKIAFTLWMGEVGVHVS